jgi:hypothetical protein
MRLNRLDTHDRFLFVKKKQELNVFKGAEDCLKTNSLSLALQEKSPYIYIFAHPRTSPDGITKVLYWQPRLSKPKCELNSYLFRAESKTDLVEVCWILPPKEQWSTFKKGNMFASDLIQWSIEQYTKNKVSLESPDPQDVSDSRGHEIMLSIVAEMQKDKTLGKWFDPEILAKVDSTPSS